MVTQAPATAFACSQLATLAQKKRCLGTASQSLGVYVRCRLTPSALVPTSPMVTQAPANAFACSQLATLAQKKRYLGTASQSLGVLVRCRLTPSALVPAN